MARELVYYCLWMLTAVATWAMILKTAAVLLGDSVLLRGVNALTGRRPLGRLYKKRARLALANHLECESLREVLAEALKRV